MIPYAGKDPWERQIGEGYIPWSKYDAAYERFSFGWDTHKIAQFMGVSEAKVLKYITIERSRLLGLPNPYGVSE